MTAPSEAQPRLYTIKQVAAYLQVHPVTVRKWIACGVVSVVRVGPVGFGVRITAAELARMISCARRADSTA